MPTSQLEPMKNFGLVDASTGYDASATSILLQSGQGALLPDPATEGQYYLTWFNRTDYNNASQDTAHEVVLVTAKSTDTLTVTRAQQSTSAVAHNTAGKTYSFSLGITKSSWDGVQTYIRRQAGQLVTSTGSANTQAISVDSGITAYNTGDRFIFIAGYTNTGAATLNVNSIGAKSILFNNATLAANTLTAGWTYEVLYDGTNMVIVGGNTSGIITDPELVQNDGLTTCYTDDLTNTITRQSTNFAKVRNALSIEVGRMYVAGVSQSIAFSSLLASANGGSCITTNGYHYVYVVYSVGTTKALYRIANTGDIATAGNWTSLTLSGASFTHNTQFIGFDGVNFWFVNTVIPSFFKATLSGTTMTEGATVSVTGSNYTSTSRVNSVGIYASFAASPVLRQADLTGSLQVDKTIHAPNSGFVTAKNFYVSSSATAPFVKVTF